MSKTMIEAERHARRFWVSFVVLLLTIQVAIGGVAIYLATGDPSVAIVPDYHNVALNWDAHRRARSAPERLGWKLNTVVSDVADARGMRAVELHIEQEAGLPVSELRIVGTAYHHANASAVVPIEFAAIGNGRYLSMVPMSRTGLWEFELQTSSDSGPVEFVSTIEVAQR